MLFGIRWGSLRTKIIAWSFVPAAMILVAVAMVIFYAYQDVTEDLVIGRNRELTHLMAGQFTAELKEYADLLDAEARTSDIYGNDPVAQRDALKGASNRLADFDAGVLILDTFGTVVVTEPERPEVMEQNWSDRIYYRQILRSQISGSPGPVFSDIVADGPGGTEVIVVAVPITGPQSEFVGIIAGMFRVDATTASAFYGHILKLRLGESGSAYLVDGNGRVIYHSDPDRIEDDFSAQELVQQVLSGEVSAVRTRDLDGQEIVASFAPVPGTSWGLVTQESWAALTDASRGYGQFLLLLLALGVVVPALVVAVGVRRITRPITELIGAAQEVARGNFGQMITARTGDEIEELAEQFNLMAAQLQESYAHLEQRLVERMRAEEALRESEARYRGLFDDSPISLWEEDFSEVKSYLDSLQDSGITDFGAYFENHPEAVRSCAAMAKIVDVNRATLDMLRAESKEELLANLTRVFGKESYDVFREELVSLVKGKKVFESEAIHQTLDSNEIHVSLRLTIAPGYEETWSKVFVSLTDITDRVRAEEALRRYTEQLEALRQASLRLTSSLALQSVLDTVLEHALQLIAADDAHIFLYDGENLTFGAAFWAGDRQKEPYAEPRQDGLTYTVARTGERIVVPDVDNHPLYQGQGWSWGGAIVGLPLRIGEQVCGVMSVAFEKPHTFDESELRVLELLADQAAVAIENARLHEQVQQHAATLEQRVAERTKELATLNAVAETASRSLELEAMLTAALDKVLGVLEFESGGIYLKDLKTGELQMACHRGLSDAFRRVVAKGIISARTAESGSPIIIDDLSKEPDAPDEVVEERYCSVASIPLLSKGQLHGVLTTASRQLRRFRQEDVDLLLSIGNQIGVAIENARLFKVEQRRAEEFRVISEVGRHITSILAVDELLGEIARLLKETLGYYLVGIALIEGDELIFRAGAGAVWDTPEFQPPRLKVGQEGITGWVVQSGEPLLVPDVSQEPRYYSIPQTSEIRSELAVPLKTKEAVIGVLHVQSDHLNAFDESDLAVLQSLAHQAAIAIENARLFAEHERRIDEMAVLNEVGQAISSTLRLDELLNLIHHQVGRVMDATNLYIALYDRDEDWVSFPLYVEGDQVRRDTRGRKTGRGLTEHIIRSRQPLLLSDDVEGRTQELGIEPIGAPAKSWLGVPMIAGDEVLGVIAVQSYTTEDVYDEEHLNLLSTIAAQAAIAIENAQLYEQAQELAAVEERQRLARDLHDAVTQTLFSASLIADVLPRLWERDPDEGQRRLTELRELTRGALAEMRTLLLELRPAALADAELGDLLRQLAESITGRARVPVTLTMEGQRPLPLEVKVALYRIAHEALNNVAKHAGASQATVSLRCTPPFPLDFGGEQRGGVELHVSDDGHGFDPESIPPESLGLGIMRERAEAIGATLTVESEIGRGTEVMVVWPDIQKYTKDA